MKKIVIFLLIVVITSIAVAQDNAGSFESAEHFDSSGVRPCPFIPGDAIKVSVFPDTAMFPSGTYQIDGEGYVDFPIIGYIKITSMSILELTELLKKTYMPFIRFPYVVVRPLMRISLFGGFARPGLYYVDPHATLWDAVRLGGTTVRRDGLKRMVWERDNTTIQKNIIPHFQSQQSLYQIGFRSGDRLSVTNRPEMTSWESFRTNVLPALSVVMSVTMSAASIYQTYFVLKETRNR
ncbi:MAG TPA: polysaccharide biosynthesis/export family protein [Chitinispirillaceae bacterium]|nr:polysaccharide biosynthesis/export family protein [Chitinispirillaceae bacterium]